MKKILFAIGTLALLNGCNQNKGSMEEVCAQFDQVDAEMLQLIERIKSKHVGKEKFLRKFNMEQVYWIQYRDTHLQALYPADWDRHFRKQYGREAFNSCKCQEMIRYTELRIDELERWIEGGPSSQDDCPSMWNLK